MLPATVAITRTSAPTTTRIAPIRGEALADVAHVVALRQPPRGRPHATGIAATGGGEVSERSILNNRPFGERIARAA
jgi:hypothetical protein